VERLDDLSTLKVVAFRIARATGLVVIGTPGLVSSVTRVDRPRELIARRRLDGQRPPVFVAARQRGDGSDDDAEQQALNGKGDRFVSHSGAAKASKSKSRGTPAKVAAISTGVGVGAGPPMGVTSGCDLELEVLISSPMVC
jgi:hypothetical protein